MSTRENIRLIARPPFILKAHSEEPYYVLFADVPFKARKADMG